MSLEFSGQSVPSAVPDEYGFSVVRPGVEQFNYAVWLPDHTTPGVFFASRSAGSENLFDEQGAYFKRLKRIADFAAIGNVGSVLEAMGVRIEISPPEDTTQSSIVIYTESLEDLRTNTTALAESGVLSAGPRMRLGLHDRSPLFGLRTLVEAIHNRTTLVSCAMANDPQATREHNADKVHDLFDHALLALLESDEMVDLQIQKTGRLLENLEEGEESPELQTYAMRYDDTATIQEGVSLLSGDTRAQSNWQEILGVESAAMPGIVERWRNQLYNLEVPQQ